MERWFTYSCRNRFEGKQSKFESIDSLIQYILWYTVAGSFGHYFGSPKRMDIELKPINLPPVVIPYGFKFHDEHIDLSKGSDKYCKIFGPLNIDCGETEEGVKVKLVERFQNNIAFIRQPRRLSYTCDSYRLIQ